MGKIAKKHLRILDIDLDFFLNQKNTTNVFAEKRLDENDYKPWEKEKVKKYLEENCGLNTKLPIRGKYFKTHDEVFYYLRGMQDATGFQMTYEIDHIDAHADLGMGDSSYSYIATDILTGDVRQRYHPKKIRGWEGLSQGNFLVFLIACRCITSLNYVNRKDWMNDIPWFIYKDFNVKSKYIQLKKFTIDQMIWIFQKNNALERAKLFKLDRIEPKVGFKKTASDKFKSDGKYDLVFLTQSPQYTPATADALVPLIQTYMMIA